MDAPDILSSTGGTLANITRSSYYPHGKVKATWGDQTNPVFSFYDGLLRMSGLRTYRNLAHNSEPTGSTPGGDDTAWDYHPQRGFLSGKRDATQKGATYTYTTAGRLATRTWARGVVTNSLGPTN